jgi:hypothetical protein
MSGLVWEEGVREVMDGKDEEEGVREERGVELTDDDAVSCFSLT